MRKTVWGAIFINSALALAFAIYTVVAIATGLGKKSHTIVEQSIVLRVNDELSVLSKDVVFEGSENILSLENGKYIATKAGQFKYTVTNQDRTKTTYSVIVYDYGDGSRDNPYNITKAADLFDLDGNNADIHDKDQLTKYYVLRNDIDMKGIEWIPVGSRLPKAFDDQIANNGGAYSEKAITSGTKFKGSFDGNGYAIKNLNIEITRTNIEKYVSFYYRVNSLNNCYVYRAYLDVGFFGYIDGGAKICNVVFDNSNISLSSDIYDGSFANFVSTDNNYPGKNTPIKIYSAANESNDGAIKMTATFGVVAGKACNSSITNISINNSALTAGSGAGTETSSGVGLFVGYVEYSEFAKISINSCELKANAISTVLGGIIGYANHYASGNSFEFVDKQTTIDQAKINGLKIVGDSYGGATGLSSSYTAGLVAIGYGIKVKDVETDNLEISLNGNYGGRITVLSGAVGVLYDVQINEGTGPKTLSAVVENVSIYANINGIDSGNAYHDVSGICVANQGELKNVRFAGTLKGFNVSGFVYQNEGKITFDNNFAGYAVNATLQPFKMGAGIACLNYNGSIIGADAKTNVRIEVDSYVQSIESEFNAVTNNNQTPNFVVSGIAAFNMGGTIKNFAADVKSNNPINFGGGVGYVGGKYSESPRSWGYVFTTNGGITTFTQNSVLNFSETSAVENISVNAKVFTRQNSGIATVYVGGFAAKVLANSDVKNVEVSLDVNNYEGATNEQLTAYIVAGLVAEIDGEQTIAVDNAIVKHVNIYISFASQEDGETTNKIALCAGAIGFVHGQNITISNIEVTAEDGVNHIVNSCGATQEGVSQGCGAFGLIAKISGTESENKVTITNISISLTELSAYYYAFKGIGAQTNANVTGLNVNSTNVVVESSTPGYTD